MKNLYIIIAIAALATLSSCRKTEYENPDVESRKLAISVATTDFETEDPVAADSAMQILQRAFSPDPSPSAGTPTRAGDTTFEYKDSIGIYIHTTTPLAPTGIHSPNMLYTTYNAEMWSAQGHLSDILKSGTTYYATAYHPYMFRVVDPTVVTHSVAPDQSTPLALSQSDLMHTPATAVTNPTSAPTIALAFKHLLAKVVVTFAVPAMLDGQAVTGVDRVLIKSVDRTAVVNLSSGAATTPSNKGDIKMRHIDGLIVAGRELTYEAIVIPQTIATGTKFIEIYFTTAAGQRNYIYNIEKELTLIKNLKHSRTLVSIGDLCFSSVLDLTDGLAKTKLPLKIKGLKGVAWALTSTEDWMTLCATADGDYGISITGIGTGAEQTVYVNVAANTTMEGDFWEPRTARLDLASKGFSSYYTARQNFYRFDLVNSAQMVSPTRSVVGVEGFGANQVWSAASGAAWIKLGKSVVYGQGDPKASYGPHSGSLESATLFYQIEANNSDTTRSGTVIFTPATAGGKGASVTIEQAAAAVRVSHTSVVLSASAAAGVEVFTVNAPVGVSWKILSASGVASTSPAVGAVQTGVGLPVFVKATYGANGGAAVSGSIVVAYGDYGAAQQTTVAVTQSVASVKINGLLWATGNLVANGVSGARIGSPTDGGVYFQFGSLLGWKGGAYGDGAGRSAVVNAFYGGATFNASAEIAVKPSVFTKINDIGTTWPDQAGKNLYYFGHNTAPYSTLDQSSRDFAGFTAGTLAPSGVGDPCTYYLGSTWRTPTRFELEALRVASTLSWPGTWVSMSTTSYLQYVASGQTIQFPASGLRHLNGSMLYMGTNGYCWNESIFNGINSRSMTYSINYASPSHNHERRFGFPVRCVQDAPSEPVPPAANQTITIDGLKWTTGNLVANGPANVKVGASADDGLYFQFGSLVGWSGGADGSGVGIGSPALALRVNPTAYTGGTAWATCGYYSAGTSGRIPATDVAATGIGDACRYYLGGTWRLPAAEEFKALCNNAANYADLALANAAWQASPAGVNFNNSGTKLFIPASGLRYSANGGFGYVGTTGYCWSGSVYDATFGYLMNFNNLRVHPQSAYSRRDGYPVRCVDGVFIAIDTSEWKSVVVAGASLDVTVRVESASGWTASVPATKGFTASPLSGKSGDKIKLTWASNAADGSPARSATVTFTATAGGVTKTTTLLTEQVASGPENIKIGGLKWATMNVGATTPQGYGTYHAWTPTLNPCPSGWRMPTPAEFVALDVAGRGEWTTYNGINGRWFGPNAASSNSSTAIFLPAAGYRRDGLLNGVNTYGAYWSSTELNTNSAYNFIVLASLVQHGTFLKTDESVVRCVQDLPTVPTPPTADQTITIGGLKWTTGNLVANGGQNCKVGAPLDGGLYFQFGSLVGWSGGANGNGVGTGSPALAVNVKPSTYGTTPAYTACPYFTAGTDATTSVPFATDGGASAIGDPCRFYLGGTWRLPTPAEYLAMHNAGSVTHYGGWKAANPGYIKYPNGLQFPASGFRRESDGVTYYVGQRGYCWSESVLNANLGYLLHFGNGGVEPQNTNVRQLGMPVRCVQ